MGNTAWYQLVQNQTGTFPVEVQVNRHPFIHSSVGSVTALSSFVRMLYSRAAILRQRSQVGL